MFDFHAYQRRVAVLVVSIVVLGVDSGAAPSVWYMAPFFSGGGYCAEATEFAIALDERLPLGHLKLLPFGDSVNQEYAASLPRNHSVFRRMQLYGSPSLSESFVICHGEPGAWSAPEPAWETHPLLQCPPQADVWSEAPRYTIGRTMFETDSFPSGWTSRFTHVDELWVPSEFHVETFSSSGQVPRDKLIVMPESIDCERFNPHADPLSDDLLSEFSVHGVPQRSRWRFLCVGKWEERKALDVLVRAFEEEFHGDDGVELLLVSSSYHSESTLEEQFLQAVGGSHHSHIVVLENVPFGAMPRLYASADAFVLPSRGEGWGRPYCEAMCTALPVIATLFGGECAAHRERYSDVQAGGSYARAGQSTYMSEENVYVLNHTLVECPHHEGHRWANPSMGHLRMLMREIFSNRDAALEKGRAARSHLQQHYSIDAVGQLMMARLEHVSAALGHGGEASPPPPHSWEKHDL